MPFSQTFTFDRDFQIGIVALMIQDFEFLLLSANLIQPNYFEDPVLMWFFQKVRDYYLDYNITPDVLVLNNEMNKAHQAGRIKDIDLPSYVIVADKLHLRVDAKDYVIDEVVRFCRRQSVRKALLESAPMAETDDPEAWDKIEAKMREACNTGAHIKDVGIEYFLSYQERLRNRLLKAEDNIFPTGITELDRILGGGVKPGQLFIWLGGSGHGKCLQKGTKVLRFDGTVVAVEDVKVGDLLLGPGTNKTQRKVLSLTSGTEELWKVEPFQGMSFVCTYDHVLTLVNMNTKVFIDITVRDYIAMDAGFKVQHKLTRLAPKFLPYDQVYTGIKSITSVGEGEYYGFMLDGDHRFLLSDFTVTHNSVALPHCGRRAVIGGHKAAHYTLELSQEDVAERYDSAWSCVPVHHVLQETATVVEHLTKVKMKYGNSLVIKEYPSGQATVNTIRQHLTSLRNVGFNTDVVVVDYGDLLKPQTNYNDEYADLGSIFRDLRGLGSELKVPVFTATQVNRPGMSQEIVDIDSVSDSFRKVQIADIVVALCASPEELRNGIMRLYVAKNRNGPAKRMVTIRTDYSRMVFYDPFGVVTPVVPPGPPPPSMPNGVNAKS